MHSVIFYKHFWIKNVLFAVPVRPSFSRTVCSKLQYFNNLRDKKTKKTKTKTRPIYSELGWGRVLWVFGETADTWVNLYQICSFDADLRPVGFQIICCSLSIKSGDTGS